jgi:tRNA nucleotidyltransferase (CCA-adding enzyme)
MFYSVAGGWVRDRLLGFQGKNDIDLALDNMLGTELADVLVAWNEKQGLPPVHYHVVQLNPEKSKHLETATMKLGNFDVDFVNLRSESYSEDSRIPAMKFGTPLEDALRRDLTINSLFYNINTRQVEDMTGRGVEDLKNGIIRSPLPAMQTLLDDPLRAFRAVRFASRFHFKLDSELRSAIQNPDVRSKLQHKVSRERVSQEILQMLSHPVSSTEASVLLYQLNLLPLVLTTYFDEVDNVIIPAERKVPDDKGDSSSNISCTERDILIPSLYHIKGLNLYLLMKLYLREQAGVSMSMSDTSNTSHTRLVYGDDWESIESNSVLR